MLLVASLVSGAGCSATAPAPPLAAKAGGDFVRVPYPPPPARPEQITDQPRPDTVWLDGEWRWQGTRWAWVYGRWVAPEPGARYAPWRTRRRPSGQLEHAPSHWVDAEGHPIPSPPEVKLADADEGDRVEDVGVMVDVGRNRAPDDTERERARGDGSCDLGCRLDDDED